MKYIYPACFYEEEDKRYSVVFPDFPLATYGNDLDDALVMAIDALQGRISTMLEFGEQLPQPSTIHSVEPEAANGFVSLVYTDIDASQIAKDNTPVKKTLTIPLWLNKEAEKLRINFSATLKDALLKKIAQQTA